MKKTLTSVVMAAVLLVSAAMTGCSGTSKSEFDDGKMRDDLTAWDCAQEMGIGMNLGNTLEAYWLDENDMTAGASLINEDTPQDYETCWGAVVTTQEAIDGLKNAGFDTIRVPVYWGNMMEDDGKYEIDEAYIARVQEVIEYCRKAELYVVLNIHHYDEFLIKNHTKEETLKAVEIVWKQIAEYFKDYSDYLVFEGFNEALGSQQEGANLSEDEIYAYVNEMNQTFVDTVRATGGNNAERVLIVSGYWTNIDYTTKDKFLMPQDTAEDKLMVSVHYIDNMKYWSCRIGAADWMSYSEQQCKLLKTAFIDKGIPVFVGECNAIYDKEHMAQNAEISESSECLRYIMNLALDYELVPVIWDVHNNMYNRTTCTFRNESDLAVIGDMAAKAEQS